MKLILRMLYRRKFALIILQDKQKKGKLSGQLCLEQRFGLCIMCKNLTMRVGFHLTFKTADMEIFVFTTLSEATVNIVKINNLHLFVPTLIPSSETQVKFDNSVKNSFTISIDSRITTRRVSDTQIEYEFNNGSAHKDFSKKYSKAGHQTAAPAAAPNKEIFTAAFENLNVENYFIGIDGIRYHRDSVKVDYFTNNSLDRSRDLQQKYKEKVGEPILGLFLTCHVINNFYRLQVVDLGFQSNLRTLKIFNFLLNTGVILIVPDCF